jgi:O-antigen/teichoic acid export membrane protein
MGGRSMKNLFLIIATIGFLAFVFAVFVTAGDFVPYKMGAWAVSILAIVSLCSLAIYEREAKKDERIH